MASARNEQLPDGHPQQCSRPGCQTKRRVKTPVNLCSAHLQQFKRGTLNLDEADPVPARDEDDIIDTRAVEIAATGERQVTLTPRERLLATAWIMSEDHDHVNEVLTRRLGVSPTTAIRLVNDVKRLGIDWPGYLFPVTMSTTKGTQRR